MQAGGRRFDPGYLHQTGLATGRPAIHLGAGLFCAGASTLPAIPVIREVTREEMADVRCRLMANTFFDRWFFPNNAEKEHVLRDTALLNTKCQRSSMSPA